MEYNIRWVKDLRESDLILCNLLSFMRIYHYNLRFQDVQKSVVLEQAEAYGIIKVTVKLRTQSNKAYTPPPYYLQEEEAELFLDKMLAYFEGHNG